MATAPPRGSSHRHPEWPVGTLRPPLSRNSALDSCRITRISARGRRRNVMVSVPCLHVPRRWLVGGRRKKDSLPSTSRVKHATAQSTISPLLLFEKRVSHTCLSFPRRFCFLDSVYRIPLKAPSTLAKEIKSRADVLTPLVTGLHVKHPLVRGQLLSRSARTAFAHVYTLFSDSKGSFVLDRNS